MLRLRMHLQQLLSTMLDSPPNNQVDQLSLQPRVLASSSSHRHIEFHVFSRWRISKSWKGHLAFYVAFKSVSWEYRAGLGGRVVPTRAGREPISSSFSLPQGAFEQSAFYDAEGEAVREKAREWEREEAELAGIMGQDRPSETIEVPKHASFADAAIAVYNLR